MVDIPGAELSHSPCLQLAPSTPSLLGCKGQFLGCLLSCRVPSGGCECNLVVPRPRGHCRTTPETKRIIRMVDYTTFTLNLMVVVVSRGEFDNYQVHSINLQHTLIFNQVQTVKVCVFYTSLGPYTSGQTGNLSKEYTAELVKIRTPGRPRCPGVLSRVPPSDARSTPDGLVPSYPPDRSSPRPPMSSRH